MLTYEQALAQILETVTVLPPVDTPISEAWGRVLAETITTPHPLPPFTNSSMDGYAVRAEEVRAASAANAVFLDVQGESAAGKPFAQTLLPKHAIRIMTGAALPAGADAVVPVEDTRAEGSGVAILEPAGIGQFIREAGEDVHSDAIVLTADTVIRPAEIGLLASVGRAKVSAYPPPHVAIISTGDELVEPGKELAFGQIFNSNAYMLAAQVAEAGGVVTHQLHARDTIEALRAAFDVCAGTDMILTSGGVSVGEHDHVKSVFAERGTVDFWRVAIRPGKPIAFGRWGSTLFFGLPGNPGSSLVTFELFVRPALRKMRGLFELSRPIIQAQLTEEAEHEPGRQSFQRAIVSCEGDRYSVQPLTRQGSGSVQTLTLANALLILPADIAVIPRGAMASVLLLQSSVSL